MPALATVMAGSPTEILAPILATFGGGAWQVEAWEPEPIRYRVDQRATLGLRLLARDEETGRSEERQFYLKLYRDRAKGQRAFASQHTLFEAAAAAGAPFAAAAPVVYADDLSLLVQRELQGTSLQTIVQLQETPLYRRSVPRREPSPRFTSFRWRSRQRLPLMRFPGYNAG